MHEVGNERYKGTRSWYRNARIIFILLYTVIRLITATSLNVFISLRGDNPQWAAHKLNSQGNTTQPL